jgi:hypothetical protein
MVPILFAATTPLSYDLSNLLPVTSFRPFYFRFRLPSYFAKALPACRGAGRKIRRFYFLNIFRMFWNSVEGKYAWRFAAEMEGSVEPMT